MLLVHKTGRWRKKKDCHTRRGRRALNFQKKKQNRKQPAKNKTVQCAVRVAPKVLVFCRNPINCTGTRYQCKCSLYLYFVRVRSLSCYSVGGLVVSSLVRRANAMGTAIRTGRPADRPAMKDEASTTCTGTYKYSFYRNSPDTSFLLVLLPAPAPRTLRSHLLSRRTHERVNGCHLLLLGGGSGGSEGFNGVIETVSRQRLSTSRRHHRAAVVVVIAQRDDPWWKDVDEEEEKGYLDSLPRVLLVRHRPLLLLLILRQSGLDRDDQRAGVAFRSGGRPHHHRPLQPRKPRVGEEMEQGWTVQRASRGRRGRHLQRRQPRSPQRQGTRMHTISPHPLPTHPTNSGSSLLTRLR